MRSNDVSSASSETKNINKVGLDMPSHSGKSQAIAIADNIRTRDISLSKGKNISQGIQEMPIHQKDKSMKNNSLAKDKNLSSGDNSCKNLIVAPYSTRPDWRIRTRYGETRSSLSFPIQIQKKKKSIQM